MRRRYRSGRKKARAFRVNFKERPLARTPSNLCQPLTEWDTGPPAYFMGDGDAVARENRMGVETICTANAPVARKTKTQSTQLALNRKYG
jgi:hypothetical protein